MPDTTPDDDRPFRLRADANQWLIEKRHVHGEQSSTPGKVAWQPDGYYPTLQTAAKGLLERLVRRNGEAESLKAWAEHIRAAMDEAIEEIERVTKTATS